MKPYLIKQMEALYLAFKKEGYEVFPNVTYSDYVLHIIIRLKDKEEMAAVMKVWVELRGMAGG